MVRPCILKWIDMKTKPRKKFEDSAALGWSLAKSLQTQVKILEEVMWTIAVLGIPNTNDEEHDMLHDCIADAQDALRRLQLHRGEMI